MIIYGTNIHEPISKETIDKFLKCISGERRNRIKRFVKREDFMRGLTAEILIRAIICEILEIKNSEIVLCNGEFGKPYLKDYTDFHFNISHSGDWVICAIDNKSVGVDVEQIQPINLHIAEKYFAQSEYNSLMSLEEKERLSYFYELWTMKESFVKAVGKGLSIPLNSFTIMRSNDDYYIDYESNIFFLKQFSISENYKLSICSLNNKFPSFINFTKYEEIEKTLINGN